MQLYLSRASADTLRSVASCRFTHASPDSRLGRQSKLFLRHSLLAEPGGLAAGRPGGGSALATQWCRRGWPLQWQASKPAGSGGPSLRAAVRPTSELAQDGDVKGKYAADAPAPIVLRRRRVCLCCARWP